MYIYVSEVVDVPENVAININKTVQGVFPRGNIYLVWYDLYIANCFAFNRLCLHGCICLQTFISKIE